jgi:hypothetical protein
MRSSLTLLPCRWAGTDALFLAGNVHHEGRAIGEIDVAVATSKKQPLPSETHMRLSGHASSARSRRIAKHIGPEYGIAKLCRILVGNAPEIGVRYCFAFSG